MNGRHRRVSNVAHDELARPEACLMADFSRPGSVLHFCLGVASV